MYYIIYMTVFFFSVCEICGNCRRTLHPEFWIGQMRFSGSGVDRDLDGLGPDLVRISSAPPVAFDDRGDPGPVAGKPGIGLHFGSVVPGAVGPVMLLAAGL